MYLSHTHTNSTHISFNIKCGSLLNSIKKELYFTGLFFMIYRSLVHFFVTCTHSSTSTNTHTHTHTHTRFYTVYSIYMHTYPHTHALLHSIWIYTQHTQTHIHILICTKNVMYTHIHTHTHTHTLQHCVQCFLYRVAKTHRIPYLYRSFSAKVTYI